MVDGLSSFFTSARSFFLLSSFSLSKNSLAYFLFELFDSRSGRSFSKIKLLVVGSRLKSIFVSIVGRLSTGEGMLVGVVALVGAAVGRLFRILSTGSLVVTDTVV